MTFVRRAAWLAAVPLAAAAAQPMPASELERRCWQRSTEARTQVNLREPTAVAFSNLGPGWRVRSPFLVEFAVRGMGVAPAGKVLAGTGHHHILIDQPLPLAIGAKLPFDERHRHFGKGQTFTVLDLPPGRHTLRLLFADHDHRPYFVYSPEITVYVTGPRSAEPLRIDPTRFDETCAAWYEDETARPRPPGEWVSLVNVRDGEAVTSPLNLRMSVDGYGVCAAGARAERSGHFVLEIGDGRSLRLAGGATQTNVELPNGANRLRLRFVDGQTGQDLLPPSDTLLFVTAQQRL